MSASIHPAPLMLGPYELLQRIATGGMAEVYLARRGGPRGFQKVVALKRILPQLVQDHDFVAMFVDEARVCARLAHPNVVQVFDFGEHDGELYMAMEFVDGTTAARLVRAAASKGEDVPLECALYIVLSVLRGLDYAHNARDTENKPLSLVHRDVSPGNVLIDRSGAVKLTDFGIARAAEIERRTDAGQLKGKLGYMSPEQVVGRELDPRSDLFTTGIVLAELVMLRPLFSASSEIDVLMRIRDADLGVLDRAGTKIPDDVRAILYRALARDRTQRYPTAAAFAQAIEDCLRRRRVQVGPANVAAWIAKLGLVATRDDDSPISDRAFKPTENLRPGTGGIEALNRPPSSRTSDSGPISEPREVAPSIYHLHTRAGTTLGPMSYPRLVEYFVTAGVDPDVLVARENSEFRPIGSYPELVRFGESPALRWEEAFLPHNGAAPLDRRTLPARLIRLARGRETGVLHLRDGQRRKKVYLAQGTPEFIVSTDRSELLGEFLIRRGQVLRMEVDMALSMLPKFEGRFGDALCGLGVLRPVELFRAVNSQIQERFVELFRWGAGEVAFIRGARSHEETFPVGFDTVELVVRGIREGYQEEELEDILGDLGEEPIEPVVPLPARIESFRFSEVEENVLKSIRKSAPLSAHVRAARRFGTREDVLRAIFCGLSCEILTSKRWP